MAANTITGLRVTQWGVEATAAAGVLTVAVQPQAGDTFTIGEKTYTFVASGADEDGEINVGADLPAAKVNIVAAINGTDGWNDAHPLVTAATFSSDNCTITARHKGPNGNSIVFSETFDSGSNVMNGSGFLGGTTSGAHARGTAVAATSKIAIENLDWGDDDENNYRPQFQDGLLIRNSGGATAVQHGTRFSASDQPVVWEQLPHWLSMAIQGDVVPSWETDPTPDVFRWTFTRVPTANPQPFSMTLERRFSNGAGDVVDQRASYAMLSQLVLRYAVNEHLRMSITGFARKFETNTITSALTMPSPQLGVSALSAVYVNDTWATVGDTQLATQVLGWEITIGTGLFPQYTADNREDLDFTLHQINAGEVMVGIRLTCLMDPTTYAEESAHAAAGDLRAIQIKATGGGGRLLTLNALMQHTKPSLFRIGEQDGQDVVELELEESTDGTNFLQAILEHPTLDVVA